MDILHAESESAVTSSDPAIAKSSLKPLDASDPRLLNPAGLTVEFPHSLSHHKNWLECVKSRRTPLAPAPIAHRANAACIVSWIAMKLGRPLHWDPSAETFVDDPEANGDACAGGAGRIRRYAPRKGSRHLSLEPPRRQERAPIPVRFLCRTAPAAVQHAGESRRPADKQDPHGRLGHRREVQKEVVTVL